MTIWAWYRRLQAVREEQQRLTRTVMDLRMRIERLRESPADSAADPVHGSQDTALASFDTSSDTSADNMDVAAHAAGDTGTPYSSDSQSATHTARYSTSDSDASD